MEGRIVAVHSAWCRVATGDIVLKCVFRGRIRRETQDVYPGDFVRVREDEGAFVVDRILPRKNCLARPPVANIDQAIVVTALNNPPVDTLGIDRLMVHLEVQAIRGALCINKSDIEDPGEIARLKCVYEKAGYPVLVTSAASGEGMGSFSDLVENTVTVLAGASGVGKSRLLSRLLGIGIEVGKLGRRGRGRHTTKGVTLYKVGRSGFLADTPGFSKLGSVECEPWEVSHHYPEMAGLVHLCHFPRCLHKTEGLCAVKDALSRGEIARLRYENYLMLLEESLERVKWKYE